MGVSRYLIAFGIGAVVGAAYGLLKVRSPAPPIIALVGLLGILSGEWCVSYFMERVQGDRGARDTRAQEPQPGE